MTYTFESFCVMDELQLRSALDEYVRQSPAKAQNMLERLLESPRGEVKSESLAVMQKYFPQIVETHAIALLKDDDWLVRTTAIHVLARVRSRTARDEISQMLVSDEDECVRSWSVMYLGEHGDATSISALQDAVLNDRGHNHEGVPIAELAQKAIDRIRSR